MTVILRVPLSCPAITGLLLGMQPHGESEIGPEQPARPRVALQLHKAAYTLLFCLYNNCFTLLLCSREHGLGRRPVLVLSPQKSASSPQFSKSTQTCDMPLDLAPGGRGYGARGTQPRDFKPMKRAVAQSRRG